MLNPHLCILSQNAPATVIETDNMDLDPDLRYPEWDDPAVQELQEQNRGVYASVATPGE